jgi:hypothetical protein
MRTGRSPRWTARLDGYVATPTHGRQLLLSTTSGLEWFESPIRPSLRVSMSADATGLVQGASTARRGGLVQLYRETTVDAS